MAGGSHDSEWAHCPVAGAADGVEVALWCSSNGCLEAGKCGVWDAVFAAVIAVRSPVRDSMFGRNLWERIHSREAGTFNITGA